MDGLSAMSRLEATAAAAAVTISTARKWANVRRVAALARSAGTTMAIDSATRANLELTRTLAGERRGSLLDAIDCTVTPAGVAPAGPKAGGAADRQCCDRAAARRGLGFRCGHSVRDDISTTLRAAPDMSRALARLSVGRGGPRDLAGCATAFSRPIPRWRGSRLLREIARRSREGGATPPSLRRSPRRSSSCASRASAESGRENAVAQSREVARPPAPDRQPAPARATCRAPRQAWC